MGGIVGGIGGLAASSGIADSANGAISGYVNDAEKLTAPWTDQSAGTLADINSALGTNGATGVTAAAPEYAQLGANRIANTTNSYDTNAIGADYKQSAGFQYELQQANNATNNSASARAGLLSGATEKQLQTNAAGLASADYYKYIDEQKSGMTTDYTQRNQQLQNELSLSGQNLSAAGTGTSAYTAAMGSTASVASAQSAAASNAWNGIGSGIGSLFGLAGAA